MLLIIGSCPFHDLTFNVLWVGDEIEQVASYRLTLHALMVVNRRVPYFLGQHLSSSKKYINGGDNAFFQ